MFKNRQLKRIDVRINGRPVVELNGGSHWAETSCDYSMASYGEESEDEFAAELCRRWDLVDRWERRIAWIKDAATIALILSMFYVAWLVAYAYG